MVCPVFHRTVDRISIVVLIVGEYGLLFPGIEALGGSDAQGLKISAGISQEILRNSSGKLAYQINY